MSRISQACNDASYLKVMAALLLPIFIRQFRVSLHTAGLIGLALLNTAISVMVVRWWIKYGSIITRDPDFPSAKRSATWVGLIAVGCFLYVLVCIVLLLR